jgi:hypothetical protein
MNELRRLFAYGFDSLRKAVSGILTSDPAREIEQKVSVYILNRYAIGSPDKNGQYRGDSSGNARLAALLEHLRDRPWNVSSKADA